MRRALLGVFAFAVLAASCPNALSLDPNLEVSQYAHTAWKVRDGFTAGSISSLAQTPDGYLWLGTEFGVYRFDGVRATPLRPAGQELAGDNIESLLAARDGTLWIGTNDGLSSWKNGKLTNYTELTGYHILGLLEDREGTVWVGAFTFSPPGKLCAIAPGSIRCYGEDGRFGLGPTSLYEDTRRNLWVGVEAGMWRWRPGSPEFFSLDSDAGGIRSFAEDKETLLIASLGQIKSFVNARSKPYPLPGFSERFLTQRMLRERDGGLWIGTLDRGLLRVHQGKTDRFDKTDGLSGDRVNAILEDREGNIWVATQDGLDRFRCYAIPSLSETQGLSNANAWSVLAARDGSIWIGNNNGLNRWKDGHMWRFPAPKKQDNKFDFAPNSLLQDSAGRVWVSTQHGFGYLENQRFVGVSGIPVGDTRDIVELGAGDLWLAHQEAGLLHVAQGKLAEQVPWSRIANRDFALVTAADPSHTGLWLGFFKGGIAYVAHGQVRAQYSVSDGLGKGRVNGLQFGPRGSLWAATEGGLSRIKDGQVRTLTSKNGLPCDPVIWSLQDNDHSMWLYMPCGLVRITRSELDSWVADRNKVVKTTVFGISDGVRGHGVPSGYGPRVTKSADGKIWFTTWDGISIIDPHNIPSNPLPPPVQVERVMADDKAYEVHDGMRLPAQLHYLTIDYTGLSLVAPEMVRFRYKLDGLDTEWREVVNDREVQYSNLGPGTYSFHVKACNNSGVWNEQGASLDFVIPPAWYQTRWFYALCAATFLLMLWGLYHLRVLQLRREFNAALEGRVAERTRVARDLHDTLLQSFHGLLLRFGIVDRLLPGRAEEAKKELQRAMELATAAITEGRDAVQGLRDSTIESNDLVAAIKTIGEQLAASETNHSSARFAVQVDGASRELRPLLRDEVYRIATESLRNAFRHANASRIEAEIRYGEKQFRLRIIDDGKGIDPTFLSDGREGHYGLPGMRERAQLVGGKLAVWSELNGGTEVELTIPAANAYEVGPRTSWWSQRFSGKESAGQETKIGS